MTSRTQPPWTPPKPVEGFPKVKIYNSLTRRKDEFYPADEETGIVRLYSCGATVYDDCHLGHARNFVTTDILRRILVDYFGYKLQFVMNVTDIDDKIILRSRQQHFLAQLKDENPSSGSVPETVLATTREAFMAYLKNLPSISPSTSPETFSGEAKSAYGELLDRQSADESEAKKKMHIKTLESAAQALQKPGNVDEFYNDTTDILLPYLGEIHKAKLDSKDHSVLLKFTKHFESRFLEDMKTLNVLAPDRLTRVTDYVPEIVKFVEKIISNGFAYATPDGSVYFDINAFEKAGHPYARLEPWNRNNESLQADGEGSLANKETVKRSDADFALWKSSKVGEPSWPSPWGPGRPGWHIECSVMASEVLGSVLDIHGGGIDLKFPHHDNELAQSEAYWTSGKQWVNYFIHTGHLSIQGLKMSKSLKNFTTIRAAMQNPEWSPRRLRLSFLLASWADSIEITEGLISEVSSLESKFDNFFLKAVDLYRHPTPADGGASSVSEDEKLLAALENAKANVDAALLDSFNTALAIQFISGLVTEFNSATSVSDATVLLAAQWITRILTIFGLDETNESSDSTRIGWSGINIPSAANAYVYPAAQLRDSIRQSIRSGALDYDAIVKLADNAKLEETSSAEPEAAKPYQAVFAGFRDSVKSLAESKAPSKDLLALCDALRDTHLWNLDIYLEDRLDKPAMVRRVDQALKAERAERESIAARKAVEKAKRDAETAEKRQQQDEKAKVNHLDMFRTSEYSEWDENGVPTKDAKGEEVTKSKRKKLIKDWERQKKLYEGWVEAQG